jgi:hypothetical protein
LFHPVKSLKNYSVSKIVLTRERSEQFLKQNSFLTYFWRFLGSNSLEQLEKMIRNQFRNMQEKLENIPFFKIVPTFSFSPGCIFNPIMAMGFLAMFIFQLDNTNL